MAPHENDNCVCLQILQLEPDFVVWETPSGCTAPVHLHIKNMLQFHQIPSHFPVWICFMHFITFISLQSAPQQAEWECECSGEEKAHNLDQEQVQMREKEAWMRREQLLDQRRGGWWGGNDGEGTERQKSYHFLKRAACSPEIWRDLQAEKGGGA